MTNNELKYYQKIEAIETNPKMLDAFFSYFEDYLKESGLLETFKAEVERQGKPIRRCSIIEYINYNLNWAITRQGHPFWAKQDCIWRNHIKSLLTQKHEKI